MKIRFQGIEGYAYGAVQPSAVIRFARDSGATAQFVSRLEAFEHHLDAADIEPGDRDAAEDGTGLSTERRLVSCLRALNRYCGDRAFSPNSAFMEDLHQAFAVPTLSIALVRQNLGALTELLSAPGGTVTAPEVNAFIETQRKAVARQLPPGTNRVNLLRAAAERKLPFRIFGAPLVIFGYGSGSFVLNSSMSEGDSSIGVSLAMSKVATNQFLKLSGFPVPRQRVIKTEEMAKTFAKDCGYPLVLKPDNESQGRGVIAAISDEAELLRFFRDLSSRYGDLIIEEHVPGDHYRIDFIGDERVKAVRRRASSVVGDGRRSVRALLEELNRDPIRRDRYSSMKQVAIDSDLNRTLEKQGLHLDSVPETGRSVTLKSISNLGMGGVQVDVAEEVHEENYALCRSVARTMRLHVAGIDILSPDISRPWYENGARICEVNAQPQLGDSRSKAYGQLLDHLAKPLPRIDLEISNRYARVEAPLFDPQLDHIRIRIAPAQILRNGCPAQYFDSVAFGEDLSREERQAVEAVLGSVTPQGTRA